MYLCIVVALLLLEVSSSQGKFHKTQNSQYKPVSNGHSNYQTLETFLIIRSPPNMIPDVMCQG